MDGRCSLIPLPNGFGMGNARLSWRLAPVSLEPRVGDADLLSARPMAPGCKMAACPDPQQDRDGRCSLEARSPEGRL